MPLAILEARIQEIASELAQYNGHRTVWLSETGELVHAEPEHMLELRGFTYVLTAFRPTNEELTLAALRVVRVELDEPVRKAMATWAAPLSTRLESNLVPAM